MSLATSQVLIVLICYRGADQSLARPTSRCILFDSENISFDASLIIIIIIIIIIIGIQPLGRSGQRPEFSQATGMTLVRCILDNSLGVACHCLPPLFSLVIYIYKQY